MAYDYDALYRTTPDALGPPTPAIVAFFDNLGPPQRSVLDIGCGQGRDALFIARLGHRVTGVDLSEHGIRDLNAAAAKESLPITGIVADLAQYTPDTSFDIILIDRTLHILAPEPRHAFLARLLDHTAPDGWVVIADEPSNLPGLKAIAEAHARPWRVERQEKGLLLLQHVASG